MAKSGKSGQLTFLSARNVNGASLKTLSLAKAVGVVVVIAATAVSVSAATTFTSLLSFDGTDGSRPDHIALVQATDGNLYGTAQYGGANSQGTVFKISPTGTLTTLYNFCSEASCADGAQPLGTLIQASNGDLYGTADEGGAYGYGTFFKITTSGTLTTLYNFCSKASCTDGAYPEGPLTPDAAGNYYGTAYSGGANGDGTVFKITPSGTLTTLHSFNGTDGTGPSGGVIEVNGVFYGTASGGGTAGDGTVFKMTTAGVLTTLHSFTGSDGNTPNGWLVPATNGNLYGTTNSGGANGAGSVFEITLAGKLTSLYSFCSLTGCADGYGGTAGLMQGTDGNLYGNTGYGGANNDGTNYRLTTTGVLTTLHSFDGTDGRDPDGGLMQDTNGDFYGVCYFGGTDGYGTLFSLSVGLPAFLELQSASGKEGAKIGILGQGFSSSSVVKVGGTLATSVTHTGTTFITATVPAGALTGSVTVTTGTATLTSTKTFKVLPTMTSFSPPSGPVGTAVTIKGTGLKQTTKVTFDGKSASFTVTSDTEIMADVPTGAVTGKILVTTKGGSATSATNFTVN